MEGNLRDVYLLLREANVSSTTYEYIRTVLPGDNHNNFNHSTKKNFLNLPAKRKKQDKQIFITSIPILKVIF